MDELRAKRLARFDPPSTSSSAAIMTTDGMIRPHRQKASLDPDLEATSPTGESLPSPPPSPPGVNTSLADEGLDEDPELAMAIALSLEQDNEAPACTTPQSRPPSSAPGAPARRPARRSLSSSKPTTPAANDLWDPPRYVPPAISEGDRTLSLVEAAAVRDGGYTWQPARALLDTGNAGLTLIDARFAARHAIHREGWPAERQTVLRGVVPGATSQAPVVTVALQIRGHELLIPAAVSTLPNEDVLVSMDVIKELFAAGFRMGVGSAWTGQRTRAHTRTP